MLSKILGFIRAHKKLTVVLAAIITIPATALVIGLHYQWSHRGETTEWGISFSPKYATELGVDWREAYRSTLADNEFSRVRLMSYWDEYEPLKDDYAFTDLDWQFDQAQDSGAEVLLAVGMRQPRWPECHVPEWASELPDVSFRTQLVEYLATVVERYRDHPALAGYHLENEAANGSFGDCPPLDHALLTREFETIKALDPWTPVTISVSNQYGIPLRGPVADEYAMSIYREAYFHLFGREVHWNYSFVPSWWHSFRAGLIGMIHDRPVYVHELQTEPWGPEATVYLTLEEQAETMDSERIASNARYAERIGVEKIYLWGAEWWYWRLTEFGDPDLYRAVDDVIAAE